MAVETLTRLVLMDPTVEATPKPGTMASRPSTLDGKVVGLLDNTKSNGKELLDLVYELLAQRHKLGGVVRARKEGASHIASEGVLADLAARCDVAITAIGD